MTQQLDDEIGDDAGADASASGSRRAAGRGDDVLAARGAGNLLALFNMKHELRGHELEPLGAGRMHAGLPSPTDRTDAVRLGDGRCGDLSNHRVREANRGATVVIRALLLRRRLRGVRRRAFLGIILRGIGGLRRRLGRGQDGRLAPLERRVERGRVAAEGQEELLELLAVEALAAGAKDHAREAPRNVFLLRAAVTQRDGRLAQKRAGFVASADIDEQVGGIERGVEADHALGNLLLEGLDEQPFEDRLAHRLELGSRKAEQLGRPADAALLL